MTPAPRLLRRRLIFLCGVVPTFATALLTLYRPAFLARTDNAVYDTLLRTAPTGRPDGRVVIVDVDERSLAQVGQWPWRRDQVARLITRLREMGAATIALDVIFAEPDRDSRAVDRASIETATGTPDAILADTLAAGGVVLGFGMMFDPAMPANDACVLHPVHLTLVEPADESTDAPYFHATSGVCSLPMLARAAKSSGFLNAAPDADGILRRVPLVMELGGRVYPSLAFAAVNETMGHRDATLRVVNANASSLIAGTRDVPLDGKGNLLLRYRGKKHTLAYVSAADVLAGGVPNDRVNGRIVFVGTTALGTREVVATPLDTLFTGVEVQATVADNLLQEDFIRRSPAATLLESLLAAMAGTAMVVLMATTGVMRAVLATVFTVAGLWIGAIWLLSSAGVVLSPLFATVGIVFGVGGSTLARVAVERQRADHEGRSKATAQQLMVQTLLSLTETRDKETGRHSRRTQQYARLIAQQLARNPPYGDYLTPERIDLLSSLAPIHDIGKVGVPDHILNKPGTLTPDELAVMQTHPALGRDVILKAEQQVGVRDDAILTMAKEIVYTHHERWDGTGYPQGLSGTNIPLVGRVMAIIDVYDAIATRSLYKAPMTHADAVSFVVRGKGTHFDPAVVDAFVTVAPLFERVSRQA